MKPSPRPKLRRLGARAFGGAVGGDHRVGFCGIDVGTRSVRAAVLDEHGRLLGDGSAVIASDWCLGPRHEQSADSWWMALVEAVRSALAALSDQVVIGAVALDATSGTLLVEGADGSARGPALMYDDLRAASEAELAQAVGARLWDVLGYRMQPSWALPKAMWLVARGMVGAGERVVHQSDHLVRRLVGAPVPTDTSNALKTGVDLRVATWPADVFDELGLSTSTFPEVVLPGTVIGAVGVEGAVATGLLTGTPVRAGMTDGCAAQIAAAALRPGRWVSVLGTTLVVKGSTREVVRDPGGTVYSHRHPDGGWLPGGASSTGAGVIAQLFGTDPEVLDVLTAQAAALPPVSGVTYPLAGTGERFPFVAPAAHGFLAEDALTPAAHFAALCTGVAYVERLAYDVLASLGADVSGPVALTGGAARNNWWNQLRTDVLGRPTLRPSSVEAAVGMAVLAAAPEGQLTETAERMVQVSDEYLPDEARGRELRSGYLRLVDALCERGWLDAGLAERALATGTLPL